jgi:hypothetical protein
MFKVTDKMRSYIETALWCSNDDNETPLDQNYCIDDFNQEELEKAQKDIESFWEKANKFAGFDSLDDSQVAHDFWLTRNRHGAGFWDGDYPEELGEQLTNLSHEFGEVDIYLGDDSWLYFSP